jgi:hypothetical protein
LAASCLATQILPRPPNLEFASLITFVTGVVVGGFTGAVLGGLVMFVNGFLSPYGFGGIVIPLQMLGMALIGFIGGLFTKFGKRGVIRLCVEAAVIGAILTIIYDIITNVGFAIMFSVPIVPTLIAGIVFSFMHITYNTILFGFLVVPLSHVMQNIYLPKKPVAS